MAASLELNRSDWKTIIMVKTKICKNNIPEQFLFIHFTCNTAFYGCWTVPLKSGISQICKVREKKKTVLFRMAHFSLYFALSFYETVSCILQIVFTALHIWIIISINRTHTLYFSLSFVYKNLGFLMVVNTGVDISWGSIGFIVMHPSFSGGWRNSLAIIMAIHR